MPARHLAITMGDPAGIGPEIIVKSAARLRDRIQSGELAFVVIGSNRALEQARAQFTPDLEIPEVTEAGATWPALCALQAGPEGEPIRQVSSPPMAVASPSRCRARRTPCAIGPRRRDRHGAPEQGGAEHGRLSLPRPHRDARGTDGRERLLHDARARQYAREPSHDAHCARGRAEARHPRPPAPGDRADA